MRCSNALWVISDPCVGTLVCRCWIVGWPRLGKQPEYNAFPTMTTPLYVLAIATKITSRCGTTQMGMHRFIIVVLLKPNPSRIIRGARIVVYVSRTLLRTGLQKAVCTALRIAYQLQCRKKRNTWRPAPCSTYCLATRMNDFAGMSKDRGTL